MTRSNSNNSNNSNNSYSIVRPADMVAVVTWLQIPSPVCGLESHRQRSDGLVWFGLVCTKTTPDPVVLRITTAHVTLVTTP
jgi:hypothetical protein